MKNQIQQQLQPLQQQQQQIQIQDPAQKLCNPICEERQIRTNKFGQITVAGKTFSQVGSKNVCFGCISEAGWISITHVGSENLYFRFKTDDGEELNGYCKCL